MRSKFQPSITKVVGATSRKRQMEERTSVIIRRYKGFRHSLRNPTNKKWLSKMGSAIQEFFIYVSYSEEIFFSLLFANEASPLQD